MKSTLKCDLLEFLHSMLSVNGSEITVNCALCNCSSRGLVKEVYLMTILG